MAQQSLPSDFPTFLSNPLEWATQHWREEMEVIMGAPIAFSVAIFVVGFFLWKALQIYNKKKTEDLEGRLEFKDERIRSLEYRVEHEVGELKERLAAGEDTLAKVSSLLKERDEQIQTLKKEGTSTLSLLCARGQGDLVIHSALYGLGSRRDIDITGRLCEVVENGELHLRVDPVNLRCEDPYPGEPKSLRVICSHGDKKHRTVQRRDYEYLNERVIPRLCRGTRKV